MRHKIEAEPPVLTGPRLTVSHSEDRGVHRYGEIDCDVCVAYRLAQLIDHHACHHDRVVNDGTGTRDPEQCADCADGGNTRA
jgi:hypothetical protein